VDKPSWKNLLATSGQLSTPAHGQPPKTFPVTAPELALTPLRILVNSRSKARYRRASNEAGLVAALRERFKGEKYEVFQVNLSDLPFVEQVRKAMQA
jgi:hypothetical protein